MVAQLTESQRLAHERIMALQRVYDAAVAVVKADEVVSAVPDFYEAQNMFDEAMGRLGSEIWNTQFILEEKYPFADQEIRDAIEAKRMQRINDGGQQVRMDLA